MFTTVNYFSCSPGFFFPFSWLKFWEKLPTLNSTLHFQYWDLIYCLYIVKHWFYNCLFISIRYFVLNVFKLNMRFLVNLYHHFRIVCFFLWRISAAKSYNHLVALYHMIVKVIKYPVFMWHSEFLYLWHFTFITCCNGQYFLLLSLESDNLIASFN